MGDCSKGDEWLDSAGKVFIFQSMMKHNLYSIIIHFKIGWPVYSAKGCVPHFLNVLLRAAGQVSSIELLIDL